MSCITMNSSSATRRRQRHRIIVIVEEKADCHTMEDSSRSSSAVAPPPLPLTEGKKNKAAPPSSAHRRKRKKGEPKPKMTKEERRAKFTAIAHNRRDANIARARDKHLICYRCRKTGHSAENCKNSAIADSKSDNEVGDTSADGAEGKEKIPHSIKKQRGGVGGNICYKCGSTEHRIQACPKLKAFLPVGGAKKNTKIDFGKLGELPYANCYVCNKSGHLASYCPESTKGLYPQGGSCRECGSVHHFVSDCPEKEKAKMMRHRSDGQGGGNGSNASSSDSVAIDQFLEGEHQGDEEKVAKKTKKRKVVQF